MDADRLIQDDFDFNLEPLRRRQNWEIRPKYLHNVVNLILVAHGLSYLTAHYDDEAKFDAKRVQIFASWFYADVDDASAFRVLELKPLFLATACAVNVFTGLSFMWIPINKQMLERVIKTQVSCLSIDILLVHVTSAIDYALGEVDVGYDNARPDDAFVGDDVEDEIDWPGGKLFAVLFLLFRLSYLTPGLLGATFQSVVENE